MNKNLSFHQRVHNAIGSQEVENIKARHALWHGMGYSREEWEQLWHRGAHSTWAHFFGRMVGFDEVWSGSVIDSDENKYKRYTEKCRKDPNVSHLDFRAVGVSTCHNLASPVIEVAEDGKSARATYLTPGLTAGIMGVTNHSSFKPGAGIFFERYGSDFICEGDNHWVYFHEQVCPDVLGSVTEGNWGHDLFVKAMKGEFNFGGGMHPNNITDPGPLHHDLTPVQIPQRTVPAPKPYKTLDDDNSFSPGRNDPSL